MVNILKIVYFVHSRNVGWQQSKMRTDMVWRMDDSESRLDISILEAIWPLLEVEGSWTPFFWEVKHMVKLSKPNQSIPTKSVP